MAGIAKDAKDLHSLLSSPTRDFLVRNDGEKVKIESLKGKKIGLYFSAGWCGPCQSFTPQLVEAYDELSPKACFEIVFVSSDKDEESFKDYFSKMPWLAVPFTDSDTRDRLDDVFEVTRIPTLVMVDDHGEVVNEDAASFINTYGADAYPFTPEKIEELKEMEKAKEEAQTLESLLVSGDLNYVLGKDGAKVLVSDLVGKNILFYFSAYWCSPCRDFTPKLVQVYKQIKEKDEAFELIFISSDQDQESFQKYYSKMPWLALPFGDPRITSLTKTFKLSGIPTLEAVGPTGRTLTKDARDLVGAHGANAYPFTEERTKEIEAKYDEMAKGWPKKLQHPLHEEHELELTRRDHYTCDKCEENGKIWSYRCSDCDFYLHANCALREDTKDLHSLLSSPTRDFLVRNDGQQVKIESLKGKKIALYFSAASCGLGQRFTPQLVKVYNELSPKACFEIVFVSRDKDEESFKDYFTKMPWLAVPFTDLDTRDRLNALFKVSSDVPTVGIVDDHGEVLNKDAFKIVRNCGADAYPFTPEREKEIKEEEDIARREQTLKSVLATPSRDFVISQDGNEVPISELEGKTIALFFSEESFSVCMEFTSKLVEVYKKLKENGEDFEIVMISFRDDEESCKQDFEDKPWLAFPFNYKRSWKLARHFMLPSLPGLVILGPDGKTRHSNVVGAVEDYGVVAYPFTPEKLQELDKAKAEAQTLESLLVSGDLNCVLGNDEAKVLVSDLVGKNILLYFSAQWCSPCIDFTLKLIHLYMELKEKKEAFEVIFISNDQDQESFEEYYSLMPWLALPFRDPRIPSLERTFKISDLPTLVVVGPNGKTVTEDATDLVETHGADAYPFTEDHIKEIEAKYDEMAKGWPKNLQHPLHEEHELKLTRKKSYICDKCYKEGKIWTYSCNECDFELHSNCALIEDTKATDDEAVKEGGDSWVCTLQ